MKIAVLSDIHANLPALQAVLADLPSVDATICCGDMVGYYPHANEVCDLVRENKFLTIRGNHDAYVTGHLQPNPIYALAYRTEWTKNHLSPAHFHWLNDLPIELCLKWEKLTVCVRHANPWDEETYLYPDSPRLIEIQLASHEILFVGHSHHPMRIQAGAGWVVNPGSVGQPRDWNPKASYALIDSQTREIEMRRVVYDYKNYQTYLYSIGWDEKVIQILSRQRDLL